MANIRKSGVKNSCVFDQSEVSPETERLWDTDSFSFATTPLKKFHFRLHF